MDKLFEAVNTKSYLPQPEQSTSTNRTESHQRTEKDEPKREEVEKIYMAIKWPFVCLNYCEWCCVLTFDLKCFGFGCYTSSPIEMKTETRSSQGEQTTVLSLAPDTSETTGEIICSRCRFIILFQKYSVVDLVDIFYLQERR